MIERVPLVANQPRVQVDLLKQRVGDRPVGRTAVGAEVAADRVVHRENRRPLRCDRKRMQVGLIAVAGAHDRDVLVGAVGDHHPSVAPAARDKRVLPPREHRLTVVFLDAQVRGPLTGGYRLEPDQPAGAVEDHRPVLTRPGVWRQEDVPRRLRARALGHRDRWWLQVRARDEVLEFARLRWRRRRRRCLQRTTHSIDLGDGKPPGQRRRCGAPAQHGMHGHDLPLDKRLGREEARPIALGVGGQSPGMDTAARSADEDARDVGRGHTQDTDLGEV